MPITSPYFDMGTTTTKASSRAKSKASKTKTTTTPSKTKSKPSQQVNGTKRKRQEEALAEPASRRKGTRKSARTTESSPKPRPPQPSNAQLIRFLLSAEAEPLCRPEDETRDIEERMKRGGQKKPLDVVTYSKGTTLSPFQELVCAVVLSRPISHRLGLRTARTLFNPPYELTSASKMSEAGAEDTLRQALWDARTQHKAKTRDQLHYLADLVMDRYTEPGDEDGEHLGPVLRRPDVAKTLENLTSAVKGMGPTGRDIFRRRVQWMWEESYPFVDGRSGQALREMGLPEGAEGLRDAIERWWDDGHDEEVKKRVMGDGEEERKRRAFVVVLERATGASLEGRVERILEEAGKV